MRSLIPGSYQGWIKVNTKLAYSTEDACEALSIGRTQLFELMRSGETKSVKIGRRRVIPAVALQEYLDRLLDEQQCGGSAA